MRAINGYHQSELTLLLLFKLNGPSEESCADSSVYDTEIKPHSSGNEVLGGGGHVLCPEVMKLCLLRA